MDANMTESTRVLKDNKKRIRVDFAGKMSNLDRWKLRLTSSSFWIDKVWYLARFILMVGISFIIIYPFVEKITQSFMARMDFIDPTVNLIPKNWTFDTYKAIAVENGYLGALLRTTGLSLLVALLQTLACCMIGYGLAKYKFRGVKVIFFFVIISMIIPHDTLRLSLLQHFASFDSATIQSLNIGGPLAWIFGKAPNLVGTVWPMVILSITGLAFKNSLYIFMMRQFFRGVPDELEESACVDGSNSIRTFFQIILPLSIPMMITIFLFSFSWQWTDNFYVPLLVSSSSANMMPDLINVIPDSLNAINFEAAKAYTNAIRNTAGLMIIAPLIVIYLFCQRFLVQGIERSGLVG